jgi:predicted Zn-dependent peptidase
MTHLARQEIYGDTGESLDDMLVAIDAVTDADVARVAQRLFPTGTLSLTVLGGGTPATIEAEQLALA